MVKIYHFLEFILSFCNAFSVVGVNHKNQALGVLEVVSPQGPDLILTSNIPDSEANVFIFHRLDIETCKTK